MGRYAVKLSRNTDRRAEAAGLGAPGARVRQASVNGRRAG